MAAIHLAKIVLFRTSKRPGYVQTITTFWRAPFSTAYHHAQGTNAVAEGRNVTSVLPETTWDTKKNVRTYNEVKADEAPDIDDDDDLSGVTGFVADTARQGVIKAMETAEAVGDTIRTQAMDSAYDVTTKSTQDVKDTIVAEADNNVVDTSEYRSIQDAAKSNQTETYD